MADEYRFRRIQGDTQHDEYEEDEHTGQERSSTRRSTRQEDSQHKRMGLVGQPVAMATILTCSVPI